MNGTDRERSAIELRIDPRMRPVGSGQVRRLLPYRRRRMVGPFVFADLIGPEILAPGSGLGVNAHPHIGISTVTYLFDGRIVHRDSTSAVQVIEPGAVNWMTAGAGVTHTERSDPADLGGERPIHGLQTWVALPTDAEETPAAFEHAAADTIPHDTRGGATVRVAVGSGWGLDAPISGSSPLVLAEITLTPGAQCPISTEHRELAVLAVGGDVRINHQAVPEGQLAVLRADVATSLSGSGTAIVLGGEPLGKRHIWWNFVHSDSDRIEQAKADWTAQRFPTVPNDHDPFVPLPT